jgi:hypothetical protein
MADAPLLQVQQHSPQPQHMVDAPLLRVHQLKRSVGGRTLWSNISFEVWTMSM